MAYRNRAAIRIPAIYAAVAALWIVISDRLIGAFATEKGLLFVLVTASLLYVLIFRQLARERAAQRRIDAAERMRSLGEIAARVGHDFNGVLMACGSLNTFLEDHSDGSADAKRAHDGIAAAVKRGDAMVQEILSFATPHEPLRERILLEPWLRAFCADVRASLRNGIELRHAVTPPDLPASIDPNQIHRLLMNLVNNAAEAIEGDGVIEITAVEAIELPGAVLLSIRDTGSGIDKSIAPTVFEPLMTTKRKGTGLGLAIAHRIVADHGGRITFESRAGSGTTFRVLLP
jgi:two-component system sensor histidine kinase HydH